MMTQLVNLKDHELDTVAQFMGHDIRTHREHYRLPNGTLQVAKVAKLLISLNEGKGIPKDEELNSDTITFDEMEESSDDEETAPSEKGNIVLEYLPLYQARVTLTPN